MIDEDSNLTIIDAIKMIWQVLGSSKAVLHQPYFPEINETNDAFEAIQYFYQQDWLENWSKSIAINFECDITRKEFAVLVDLAIDPFNTLPVSISV